MSLQLVLYQPEIPQNTGNIIRLAANCGASLHLIEPLGFQLTDKQCRRAGLDYHDLTHVHRHISLSAYQAAATPSRLFACSTKGHLNYSDVNYAPGDAFLLGPETRGLPADVLQMCAPRVIRIPMQDHSRSLNLANAASIVVFEAWRQLNFCALS